MANGMLVNSETQARVVVGYLTVKGYGAYRKGRRVIIENVNLHDAFVLIGSAMQATQESCSN